jgi:hypothetical protein
MVGKIDIDISIKDSDKSRAWDIQSDKDGAQTLQEALEYLKYVLISVSKEVLQDEQSRGFDSNPVTVVDGRKGKAIIDVKPFGKIEFHSRLTDLEVGVAVKEIYNNILQRSKVVTGTYIEANWVLVNGALVATNLVELLAWEKLRSDKGDIYIPGDKIRFVNMIPYARKLERLGVTAQRSKLKLVASKDKQRRTGKNIGGKMMILGNNGVYFLAFREASRKYKRLSKLKFDFVLGSSLGIAGFNIAANNGKVLRTSYKKTGRPYLYPTISFEIIGEAIK